MVLFPESPHLLEFEISLRAFLTIRRDRLKMYPPGSMGSSLKHIHTKVYSDRRGPQGTEGRQDGGSPVWIMGAGSTD